MDALYWIFGDDSTGKENVCRNVTKIPYNSIRNLSKMENTTFLIQKNELLITRTVSETLIIEFSYVFNGWHIRRIRRPRQKLYVFTWQEVLIIPCNIWTGNILLKVSSRNALKERNDFELQYFTDILVALQIVHNSYQMQSFIMRNRIPDRESRDNRVCSGEHLPVFVHYDIW